MDWSTHRITKTEFVRVEWPTLRELGGYGCFTGGTLEFSINTDIRAQGSLDFIASSEPPSGGSMVRVYVAVEDAAGDSHREALGTFFVVDPPATYGGGTVSGTVELESVLMVPMGAYPVRYVTFKKGANAVSEAVSILRGMGITVSAESTYTLPADIVYSPDDSWLTIVNDLLSRAGYSACTPDAMGGIEIAPYAEPGDRPVRWTFDDGERSIMEPDVVRSDNSADIPNAVRAVYEDDDGCIWAAAINDSPDSPTSTVSRGFERTSKLDVSELEGDSREAMLESLKAACARSLESSSAGIEYVELSHAWVPLRAGDAAAVEYKSAGKTWRGTVSDMSVSVGWAIEASTRIRSFARQGIKPRLEGGIC